jgi:hypothetical protein
MASRSSLPTIPHEQTLSRMQKPLIAGRMPLALVKRAASRGRMPFAEAGKAFSRHRRTFSRGRRTFAGQGLLAIGDRLPLSRLGSRARCAQSFLHEPHRINRTQTIARGRSGTPARSRNQQRRLGQGDRRRDRQMRRGFREIEPAIQEARPGGLEPPTVGLEIRCSIRLSYERRTGRK